MKKQRKNYVKKYNVSKEVKKGKDEREVKREIKAIA